MNNKVEIPDKYDAVRAHLGIIQATIQRMANNSASIKTWCVALVSAILVIIADKPTAEIVWIALIPTILFLVLDAYYLSLEKAFRISYNLFIDKLYKENISVSDFYAVTPSGSLFKLFLISFLSFSVWPFYLTLIVTICLAGKFLV